MFCCIICENKVSLRFSLGNYIANIANVAPNYIMPIIVLIMLGKEEAAYFYISFAIGNLILFVPNAINMAFFVERSHGLRDMGRTLRKALTFSYAYLILATLFIWFFGNIVLRFWGQYVKGLGLLRLTMLGSFFAVALKFLITTLNIRRQVKEVVIINLIRAFFFIGLSYILIPEFGIDGVGLD